MISMEEQLIIESAVMTALSFGTRMIQTSMEELRDFGYDWTQDHEDYCREYYFKIAEENPIRI